MVQEHVRGGGRPHDRLHDPATEGTPETTPVGEPASLATKLVHVADAVGRIGRNGADGSGRRAFVRETDLLDAIRPLLAEQGIWLQQSVTSHDKTGDLTILTIDFTWIDGETGQTLGPVTYIGYGADAGDMGAAKALTATLKSFLLKTLLLGTGDDPEADEDTDRRTGARGSAGAPIRTRGTAAGTGKGGEAAGAAEGRVHEVIGLAKEAGINAVDLTVLIGRVLGAKVDLGTGDPREALLSFLVGLPARDIGRVILALVALRDDPEEPQGLERFRGSAIRFDA